MSYYAELILEEQALYHKHEVAKRNVFLMRENISIEEERKVKTVMEFHRYKILELNKAIKKLKIIIK